MHAPAWQTAARVVWVTVHVTQAPPETPQCETLFRLLGSKGSIHAPSACEHIAGKVHAFVSLGQTCAIRVQRFPTQLSSVQKFESLQSDASSHSGASTHPFESGAVPAGLHVLPEAHGVSSFVCAHPVVILHVSMVQLKPSLQLSSACRHRRSTQVSVVHAFESSHSSAFMHSSPPSGNWASRVESTVASRISASKVPPSRPPSVSVSVR